MSIGIRLSIMMFLQFFIWGAWYVTTGNFMGAKDMGDSIGTAYSLCPIAAIISPFFLGMVADRFFASEKILGILHIMGGLLMFAVPALGGISTNAFLIGILLYALCYMPTLSLSNTVAFTHLKNAQNWFPIIRVLGTIGWIIAGFIVSKWLKVDGLVEESPLANISEWVTVSKWLKADTLSAQYIVTGFASILLGVFSFTLPHTPPPAKGKPLSVHDILCVDAWKMFKDKYFAIFAISSMLICIPLSAYYAYAQVFVSSMGFESPAFTMSFGQMAEVLFMFLIPFFFKRLGVKWMLAVGMLAWVVRYGLFAGAATSGLLWMVILGVALHGICYDFFFVTGQIYTDQKSSAALRGQAQGLLVCLTQGVGMVIGAQLMQMIYNKSVGNASPVAIMPAWQNFWWIPAAFAGVVLIIFILTFKADKKKIEADA